MKDWRAAKSLLHSIPRILVGLVFIASAVLKYLSIDGFDLYVFEHHLVSFDLGSIASRLLVAVECVLGILLVGNLWMPSTRFFALILLTGFTLYLLLQPVCFRLPEENCHCFGEHIRLSRWQSIGKNAVLIALLLLSRNKEQPTGKAGKWIGGVIGAVCLLCAFVINPPDCIYRKIYSGDTRIRKDVYTQSVLTKDKAGIFQNGKQVVCLYSTACHYCRNAAVKMDRMIRYHQWDTAHFRCIFWSSPNAEEQVERFFAQDDMIPLTYTTLAVDTFLLLTDGRMPVLLFSDKGQIIKSMNISEIQEKEIESFIKQQENDSE